MTARPPSPPSPSETPWSPEPGRARPSPSGPGDRPESAGREVPTLVLLEPGAKEPVELSGTPAVRALEGLVDRPGAVAWVDLAAPDERLVAAVGAALGLHPLIVEDVVEGNQRSKLEVTDGLLHVVLFALDLEAGEVVAREVDFVLGERFLLTAHPADWDPRAVGHFRAGLGPVLARGADHLLWALADGIVDGYFPVLDRLGDEIDELEDRVVAEPRPETLARVFRLKRSLLEVRRAVAPVREVFNQLTNRDLALIDESEVLWFRDVYDHLVRLTDELDTYRELVGTTLDVYLSTVNNNLSAIVKRLTSVTLLVAGVGAIGGLFGMSEATPALAGQEGLGFWAVFAGALVAAAIGAVVLRRIDWL